MKIPTENSPSEGEPVRTKPWLIFQKRPCDDYAITSRGTRKKFPARYVAILSDGREFASIEPYLQRSGDTGWSISYHGHFNSLVVYGSHRKFKLSEAKEAVLDAYLRAEADIVTLGNLEGCPFCGSIPSLRRDVFSYFVLSCSHGDPHPHAQFIGSTLAEVVAKWNTRNTEGSAKQ